VTKQKITGLLAGKTTKAPLDETERRTEKLWQSVEEESLKDIAALKLRSA
jgi:rRNA biogenesis protein RRP5